MTCQTAPEVYPFERFSEDAKKVLTRAQVEAERARHSYIGTEHLLLALLNVDGEPKRLLEGRGAGAENVRRTIENVLGRNERIIIQQIIPTSRVKKVIELSFAAAQREGSAFVTPMHLLIGLMEEGEGVAAHVLQDLGVTLETVRDGRPGPVLPAPGARVLVHDPEPPYRLWEGRVTGHGEEDGTVLVTIPDHPRTPEATVAPDLLHPIPMRPGVPCDRCRHPAEG